uniref:hypothetical protein n=1 Tax=Aeromonas sp. Ne-1 TaxID=1675689 RepID=UPI0015644E6A
MFEFSCPDCNVATLSHKVIPYKKCPICHVLMNSNEWEREIKVNTKKDYLKEETINYLKNHLDIYGEFSSLTVSQRRDYDEKLSNQIRDYDKRRLEITTEELNHRNSLVDLHLKMVENLPFDFELNKEILIKLDKNKYIKGIVEEQNPITRQVLVKPIDNVYKERFYTNEHWIYPMQKKVEIEQ